MASGVPKPNRPQGNGSSPPYGHLDCERLEPADVVAIDEGIRSSIAIAGKMTENTHALEHAELASAILAHSLDGRAAQGLQIGLLCEGRLGEGKIREKLVTSALPLTTNIAARLAQARQGRPPSYSELAVALTPSAGNSTAALGFDANPNVAARGRAMMMVLGSPDRSVTTSVRPFTTGTHDDHSSPSANRARIKGFERELGEPIPGTPPEHAEAVFKEEKQARSLSKAAAEESPHLLEEAGINADNFYKLYFPKCVIAREWSYGTPERRNESRLGVLYPGDDDDFAEVVLEANKCAIAACDINAVAPDPANARNALAKHFGETPVDIPDSILYRIAEWGPAARLAVSVSSDVSYMYFPRARRFVRLMVTVEWVDGERQFGLDAQMWHAIGLDKHVLAAITLIERAQERWPRACLERFIWQCGLGRIRPTKASIRQALYHLSAPANAGLVAGDRRAPWRGLSGGA
jgi:hypothetical protein